MYGQPFDFGQEVVIIGGGLVGCEAAAELKIRGLNVTIVEMLSQVAMGCGDSQSNAIRVGLKGVKTLVNTKCIKITAEGAWVKSEGHDEMFLPADSIVFSVGMNPHSDLVAELLQSQVSETYVIGDCLSARKMGDAIKEAYYTAVNL
jgi:pyruvate/2-oxoglutarate dehydrogenase complex dihydrolipoamide dehydrogenase (E3) component